MSHWPPLKENCPAASNALRSPYTPFGVRYSARQFLLLSKDSPALTKAAEKVCSWP